MSYRSILVAIRVAVAIVGVLLLLSSPSRATTMVRMTDEALTLGADAIVTGMVTDVRADRASTGTISTYVTIAIDTVVKGYLLHLRRRTVQTTTALTTEHAFPNEPAPKGPRSPIDRTPRLFRYARPIRNARYTCANTAT